MSQRIMNYCNLCRKLRVCPVTETADGRMGECETCKQEMPV